MSKKNRKCVHLRGAPQEAIDALQVQADAAGCPWGTAWDHVLRGLSVPEMVQAIRRGEQIARERPVVDGQPPQFHIDQKQHVTLKRAAASAKVTMAVGAAMILRACHEESMGQSVIDGIAAAMERPGEPSEPLGESPGRPEPLGESPGRPGEEDPAVTWSVDHLPPVRESVTLVLQDGGMFRGALMPPDEADGGWAWLMPLAGRDRYPVVAWAGIEHLESDPPDVSELSVLLLPEIEA